MAIVPEAETGTGSGADAREREGVVDGRRARRHRNRAAVIEALFELLDDGVTSPSAEAIASGAGVSVSSLFRYFDSLEDLQEQAIAAHFERFGPLFEVPAVDEGPLDVRIEGLVGARIALYRSIAPVARLARSRALDQPRIAQRLDETRRLLSTQVRTHFDEELAVRSDAEAGRLVDLIDTLTSFESWDLLRSTKGRTDRQVRRSWIHGIGALIT